MFISVRKYCNVKSVEEVRKRVALEFVPLLKRNRGFLGYHLIDCRSPETGDIVTAISMFETWEAALASNQSAKDFIRNRLAELIPQSAEAFGGETIVDVARQRKRLA
jgi:hypothetical protein